MASDRNHVVKRQAMEQRQRGTRAQQPEAHDVIPGTLYFVTDEEALERSSGTDWEAYA